MNALPVVPWEGAKRPPRAWQAEALPLVLDALREGRAGVVSVATGGGKSILQAELCRICLPRARATGKAIVVSAPREALVEQLAATLARRCGADAVGVYYGKKKQPTKPIIVCCNNSMPALTVDLAIRARPVSILVADECHGTESETLRETIPAMAPGRVIGFTATPFRSDDRQSLGLFDEALFTYTYEDARRDGVLVDYLPINCSDAELIGDTNDVCARMIAEYAHGPGIVSAKDIPDAEAYASYLVERGIAAAAIHSKVPGDRRRELLDDLRTGRLRCLVHVSLLAEGVDLPWLRWLCLRRPVAAKVRFVQELGRVLRVCTPYESWYEEDLRLWGPKTSALVLDPYRLLDTLGIRHPEAIGRALAEAEEAEGRKALKAMTKAEKEVALAALPLPVAVSEATAWAQRLAASMRMCGLAAEYLAAGRDTSAAPSVAQLDYLRRLTKLSRYIPEPGRTTIRALLGRAESLTWGEVSDLISVLRAIGAASADQRRACRWWSMPAEAIEGAGELDEVVVERLKRDSAARERAAGGAA